MRMADPYWSETQEEHSARLSAVMAMQARMAKKMPRIVYDHRNDTVNVYTEKDGFVWKNQKEEKENA